MIAIPTQFYPEHTHRMAQGGNLTAQTSGTDGTAFVPFASQACRQVTIANNTGVAIEVQQDGTGPTFPIFTAQYYQFHGISDTSQLAVRRIDESATQVTVACRWEQ